MASADDAIPLADGDDLIDLPAPLDTAVPGHGDTPQFLNDLPTAAAAPVESGVSNFTPASSGLPAPDDLLAPADFPDAMSGSGSTPLTPPPPTDTPAPTSEFDSRPLTPPPPDDLPTPETASSAPPPDDLPTPSVGGDFAMPDDLPALDTAPAGFESTNDFAGGDSVPDDLPGVATDMPGLETSSGGSFDTGGQQSESPSSGVNPDPFADDGAAELPPLGDDLPALGDDLPPFGDDLPDVDSGAGAEFSADDLPPLESAAGAPALDSDSLFGGEEGAVDTSLALDNGLPDAGGAPPADFAPGALDLDLDDMPDAPSLAESAPSLDDLPPGGESLSGMGAPLTGASPAPDLMGGAPKPSAPVPSQSSTASESSRSRSGLYALVAVLLAIAGVVATSFLAPEALPFAVPWVTAPGSAPKVAEVPEKSAAEKEAEAQAKAEAAANAEKPSGDEPEVPESGPAPKLTDSNVHALPYSQLQSSVDDYAASGGDSGPGMGLTLFGYFRLAHTFADTDARKKLLEIAPKKPTAKQDELTFAATLGAMVLSGKAKPAQRAGEKALRRIFQDSAVVNYAVGVAYQGKPAKKALQHLTKAIELDPGLVDASMERADLMLQARGSEGEATEALRAAVAAVPGPAISLRAAKMLARSDRYSEIGEVVSPIVASAQGEQFPPAQRDEFFQLLLGKHVRSGAFEVAKKVAAAWNEQATENLAAIEALASLEAATGGEATEIYKNELAKAEQSPTRAALHYELAKVHIARQEIDEAEDLLGALNGISGREAKGFASLLDGELAAARGKSAKAKASFAAAGRGRSNFVEPRLAILRLEAGKDVPDLAKLTQLAKRSGHAAVLLELARALEAKGNAAGAAPHYERVLWERPLVAPPLNTILSWAKAIAAAGDRERAIKHLEEMHRAQPKSTEVLEVLIDLTRSTGKFERVVKLYDDLSTLEPDNFEYVIARAEALNDSGKKGEAATALDKLIRDNPKAKTANALAELGRAYVGRDDVKARNFFRESLSKEKTPRVLLALGRVEASQQRLDEAIVKFQEALQVDSKNVEARLELGMMQMRRNLPGEAITNLKMVLDAHPGNTKAALAVADSMIAEGKFKDANRVLQKAIKSGEPTADLLQKVGALQLQQLGQLPQAVRTFERLVAIAPDRAEAHYYLGYAYKDLGRSEDAREQFEEFLELNPDPELATEVKRDLKNL